MTAHDEANDKAAATHDMAASRHGDTNHMAANALTGGGGDDRIDGRAGADTLRGVDGDDTYVVDNAGDVVTELANDGYDRIESSVSYTVPANVEAITLTGTTTPAAPPRLCSHRRTNHRGTEGTEKCTE